MNRFALILIAVVLFALALSAADISGKWTAQVPGREGQIREQVFNLKVEGDTLTGTVSGGRGGDRQISDGKVTGDEISFVVKFTTGDGTERKTLYKGKVAGNEIKFTTSREGSDRTQEFTAKKG